MSSLSSAAGGIQRIEALPIIAVFVLLLGLFMVTAPGVFMAPNIYMTFLSTLPPLILLSIGLTWSLVALYAWHSRHHVGHVRSLRERMHW